jgi:CheY-like chemotaxis protein
MVNVFYADDDEDDRFLFESAMSEINKPVALTCFASGDKLEKALIEDNYDCELVFLDLNMPGKGSLQTLESLQQAIRINNLKVIIFTTSADKQVIQKTFNQNAVLFVQKPTNFNSLVNALQEIIDNRKNLELPVSFMDFQYNFK